MGKRLINPDKQVRNFLHWWHWRPAARTKETGHIRWFSVRIRTKQQTSSSCLFRPQGSSILAKDSCGGERAVRTAQSLEVLGHNPLGSIEQRWVDIERSVQQNHCSTLAMYPRPRARATICRRSHHCKECASRRIAHGATSRPRGCFYRNRLVQPPSRWSPVTEQRTDLTCGILSRSP